MNETKIRWTDLSWNVWSGCQQISPGCAYCYAKTLAENKRGTKAFPGGFDLTYRWHKLDDPLKIKKPSRIFVNSMSDLYLEEVPDEAILRVFNVMNNAYWHEFQILTKRSERLRELAPRLRWTPNIWQGVSVENQRWTTRLDDLREVPAAIRFVSAEPLLDSIDLRPWLKDLDWVIVGGESDMRGRFRHFNVAWARDIRNQCAEAGVAFFYKQASGYRSETDPYIDGLRYEQYPTIKRKVSVLSPLPPNILKQPPLF